MAERSELCAYYDAAPEPNDSFVFQHQHPAGPGPLFFFVPVGAKAAVRVPVCERHAKVLADQFRYVI